MKKLLAVVLALMLVLASAACAERAKVMTYSKPYLALTTNGEHRETDLSSLSVRLAGGTPEGIPTIQAEVLKSGKVVERGVMQYIDGKLYLQADGLTRTYVADFTTLGANGQSAADTVFAGVDHLLDFRLPAFEGVTIDKIDMTFLAMFTGSMVSTDENGRRSASIEVPYLMVKQLLGMASRYRGSVPEAAQAYAGPLFDLIDRMLESDSGFALKGTVAGTDKGSALSLKVYPVEAGVTAEAPTAKIKLKSSKNEIELTVDMYQGEAEINVVTFELKSKPSKAVLRFSLDVMSLVLAEGRLAKEDGAQVVSLEVNALGQKTQAYARYGAADGVDFMDVSLNIPGKVDLSTELQTTEDGNGGSAGFSAIDVQLYDDAQTGIGLTGNVAEGYEDVSFRKVKNTSKAVDILHMTDEQSKQLTREAQRLLDKFVSRSRIGR